jgi:hypothetical protein
MRSSGKHAEHHRRSRSLRACLSRLGGDRARIAQLSKWVTQAARAGDAAAMDIVRQAATELALMVDATGASWDSPRCRTGGGLLLGRRLRQRRRAAIGAFTRRPARHYRPGYRVSEPVLPPAIGAALYAAKRHGRPLSNAAIERLRAQSGARRGSLDHEGVQRTNAAPLLGCGLAGVSRGAWGTPRGLLHDGGFRSSGQDRCPRAHQHDRYGADRSGRGRSLPSPDHQRRLSRFSAAGRAARIAQALVARHPDAAGLCGRVFHAGLGRAGLAAARDPSELDAAFAAGAVAVKVWKNIGMAFAMPTGAWS